MLLSLLMWACAPATSLDAATGTATDTADTGTADGVEATTPCDGSAWTRAEGAFVAMDDAVAATRPACTQVLHATAGPQDATLRVTLSAWDAATTATLTVTDLLGQPLVEADGISAGASLSWTLDRPGEYLVALAPTEATGTDTEYGLEIACASGCDTPFTRYPLVLMHGMAGTDSYLGVLDYYFGVVEALEADGYAAFAPAVDPLTTPDVRAAQWAEHLDTLEAQGWGRKFDLIAHSQGGLDARYLAGALEDPRVASIVTISSPHRGSVSADVGWGVYDAAGLDNSLVDGMYQELGELFGLESNDIGGQLQALTTDAMADFNAAVPDRSDVYYASWAGVTCGYSELSCQADWDGEVVSPLLWSTYWLNATLAGDNDGMVSVDSATWGDHQGEIPADHLDEVGQLAGATTHDHLGFFLDEAARLASLGY